MAGQEATGGQHRDARELALFRRLARTGDRATRDALVTRYVPLARSLAHRFHHLDEPFEDVVQVACLGLVKAVDRYDPSRGVAFSSYAIPTILGEIKRHFRDRTWSVRVPRALQERTLRIDRMVHELPRELRRTPTVADLARRAGLSEAEVLEALEASDAHRATSLSSPWAAAGDPTMTLGDALGIDDRGFASAEARAILFGLTPALTQRERAIVRLRFEEDLTQAAIGRRVGLSQMQVSRVLRTALAKLRDAADDDPRGAADASRG